MTKGHFAKQYDEENGWHYSQIKLQRSKNQQKTKQNLDEGGVIPFESNEYGLNPGRFIELFLTKLNPFNKSFFQRPREGKKFKKEIHMEIPGQVYYENKKVGHSYVGKMMPKVI